jgi:hypothetical protein
LWEIEFTGLCPKTAPRSPDAYTETGHRCCSFMAARIFFEESRLFNDDEIAALAKTGTYEKVAPNVPAWCYEMQEYAGATEVSVLSQVLVPVLLLRGSRIE